MTNALALVPTNTTTVTEPVTPEERWAEQITAAWRSSVEGIIRTSQLLAEAKAAIDTGTEHSSYFWASFVKHKLPFGGRTAQMLLSIAANPVLCEPNHGSRLPASWRTIADLSRWSSEELHRGFNLKCSVADLRRDLFITPETRRQDLPKLRDLARKRMRGGSPRPSTPRASATRSKPFLFELRKGMGKELMGALDALPTTVQKKLVANFRDAVERQLVGEMPA